MTAARTAAPPKRFGLADIIAGVSVAFVVIPQSLAYAEIAGMPAYTGLYAAALPAIVAAPFASSRYLQTGPVAMTSLLSFGALSTLATPGTDDYITIALLLAVIVGLARVALGLVKGGMIANYMSPPVILGFTTAAAILIIASQSATVVGFTEWPSDLLERLWNALTNPGDWTWSAIGVSVLTAALILAGRKVHPVFPGVLVAVIAGVLIGHLTGYPSELLVGDIPERLPPISFSLPWSQVPSLIVPGIIIAMVGFAEPTAIARTMAARDRERWDASQELISQGVANLASGLSGGFPVGGSFSRSSVNRMAGARTRWSGAITGVTVLAFMPFADVLAELPRAVLGAIVVVAVAGLIKIPEMIRLIRISWGQAAVAWGTALATLVLSPRVDLAVLLGVLMAAGLHLYRESSRIRVPSEYEDGTLTISPGGVLFYASAGALEETLGEELAAHPEVECLRLDLSRLGRIDYSGIATLQVIAQEARDAGLDVEVVNLPNHAKGIYERSGGI
jgi:SulP family sulfate permease